MVGQGKTQRLSRVAIPLFLASNLLALSVLFVDTRRGLAALLHASYFLICEFVFRTKAAKRLEPGQHDKNTTQATVAGCAALLGVPCLAVYVPLPLSFSLPPWLAWSLLALYPLGMFLRYWSMLTLGDSFSRTLTVRADQGVVSTGPYAFVRHPGYLANGLVFATTAVAVGCNVLVAAASALLFLTIWTRRIAMEEAMLLRVLGDKYRALMVKVPWRLVPLLY